jgi:hypothetical protein
MRTPCLLTALLLAGAAHAQPAPSTAELDTAIHRGTLASLAPLCHLRDEPWAEDLRRASVQDITHAKTPDDPTLQSAPGSNLAANALGFADAEALEDFAETSPEAACAKLAADPGLPDADRRVAAYRTSLTATHPLW